MFKYDLFGIALIFFLFDGEHGLTLLILYVYWALILFWLVLVRVLEKILQLLLAVDGHTVLLNSRLRPYWEVGSLICVWHALMIHSWEYLLLGWTKFFPSNRLCLHWWFCFPWVESWSETTFLHHFTLDDLQPLLLPLLVELITVLKVAWVWHLYVLDHSLLIDCSHHLLGHFWDLGFEGTWLLNTGFLCRWKFLLLFHLGVVPIDARLYEIISSYLRDKLLAVFVDNRFMWVVLYRIPLIIFPPDIIHLLLLFHQHILIPFMQRPRVRNLHFLPLLFLSLGNFLPERC